MSTINNKRIIAQNNSIPSFIWHREYFVKIKLRFASLWRHEFRQKLKKGLSIIKSHITRRLINKKITIDLVGIKAVFWYSIHSSSCRRPDDYMKTFHQNSSISPLLGWIRTSDIPKLLAHAFTTFWVKYKPWNPSLHILKICIYTFTHAMTCPSLCISADTTTKGGSG